MIWGTVGRTGIDADVAIGVHFAGLDHGGEEDAGSDAASVDGGTGDRRELRQGSLAVHAVDVVGFERRVGRKVETVFGGNERNRARLLVALEHGFDPAEIAGGAQDAAFVAVVAGQNPQAVLPGVVDDVVDVANAAFGEGVGDAPGRAAIAGGVDVDFFARGVVEIFSPIDCAAGNCGDVQGAGSAGDGVGLAKFRFIGTESDNRSGNRGYSPPVGRTARAWKPSRNRRAVRLLLTERRRRQGGRNVATGCQVKVEEGF